MISIIAAFMGGILTGTHVPLLSPLLYPLRVKKDLFLISFSAYCIMLCYELELESMYSLNFILIFAIAIPTILLLDTGLKGEILPSIKKWRPIGYISISSLLLGFVIRELYMFGVLLAFLHNFSDDSPKKGLIVPLAGIIFISTGFLVFKDTLDLPGSASSQVIFISALSILLTLIFWRRIQRNRIPF